MHCDVKNFRIIESKTHTIVVFCPNERQGKHGVIPLMVVTGAKTPELESVLYNANVDMPLPLRPETKVGMYLCNRRTHLHMHASSSTHPFILPGGEKQMMAGTDQLDAINNLCLMYPSIKDAVTEMKPEFFIDLKKHR